jgi:O-antigen ligase
MAPADTRADEVVRAEVRRARAMAPIVIGLGVLAGLLAGLLAGQRPMAVFALALIPLPLALWKWPLVSVVIMLSAAALVEQIPYTVRYRKGADTQRIPLFHSLVKGIGLNPFEVLLLIVLLIWIMKSILAGTMRLPRSGLSRSISILAILVVAAFVRGIMSGGVFNMAVWEARPLLYMAVMYVLVSSILDSRRAIRAILWTLVIGSGIKAVQGVRIYKFARHMSPRPDAILGHEEAFFFGLFLFITLGLWVFQQRGKLRTVATIFAPFVLVANLGNSRRTSWAIIFPGLIVFLMVAYSCLPDRRRALRRISLLLLIGAGLYFPAFWNKGTGSIGQPARAIRSEVKPDARDLSSNLYRKQENANLVLNIRESHLMGKGYGIPIHYGLPIVDISGIDQFIKFIPHDGVLYIWMRLGTIGEIVFFVFVGTAIMRAAQLTKTGDREFAMLGTIVICAMLAYVVEGYDDMGFFWFRIALCVGALLGAVEAALRIAAQRPRVERS